MSNNKFKVLIIEDEANICSFIQTLLETNGYQALVAQTCVMGMTMFISYNPDLVILDLGLPDRDGLDAIRSIRLYTVMLAKLKNTYSLMGDYKTALQYSDRLSNIRKELYARDKENAAMELAIAYETNEKETKIIKQEMELKQRNTFLGASLGIIILLILLLWISYRNSKVIKRKNKITVNQVNQLLAYKNELLAIKERDKEAELSHQEELPKSDSKTQTDPDQPIDQDSFILLEEIMHKEKLYLKSDLTREDVLKRLRMDKNRFARMIQSNTGDYYTNYISNLRMEHSIQLMKQYPYYNLEAIALDSGLGNVRALHRLFKNKIGMTPTEYKKALHVN